MRMSTSSMAFQLGASSSRSFSSSSIPRWTQDVFLSFIGEDVHQNFISHLYHALHQRGINTYIDNNLERGVEISPELFKAIEGSMISIVVFSKNYSDSKWCLDELLKILECKEMVKQIVLPLFYDVDPSDVRHQKWSFGEAFARVEYKFKADKLKLTKGKAALEKVANLSGFELGDRDELEFIQDIIKWVDSKMVDRTPLNVAKCPVRIESRVRDIYEQLNMGRNDIICIVGIFGTGGIENGIKRLTDMCLITITIHNTLWMHDLLQDMGREIIRKESRNKSGGRSRLWFYEDARHVLEENVGTNNVEGIKVVLLEGDDHDVICLTPKSFAKMKRLKFFISRGARFSGRSLNYLSNELRVLDWSNCHLESLPSNFHGEKLIDFQP
ncbi:TMV resistance protein N-like [Carya illinoinensis]|uniref:TMV resistance protein N-like n=1 Tax=Carya illinoinensis TaxID=32201 RepID=UPI001C71E51A|nr:TMV resistance protein N-like [Carya illinoinensis]